MTLLPWYPCQILVKLHNISSIDSLVVASHPNRSQMIRRQFVDVSCISTSRSCSDDKLDPPLDRTESADTERADGELRLPMGTMCWGDLQTELQLELSERSAQLLRGVATVVTPQNCERSWKFSMFDMFVKKCKGFFILARGVKDSNDMETHANCRHCCLFLQPRCWFAPKCDVFASSWCIPENV